MPSGSGSVALARVAVSAISCAGTSGIVYNVYGNNGEGGPVIYGSPVATVPTAAWKTSVSYPGNYVWHFRTYDTTTDLEDMNVTSMVTLILDAYGNDITRRPVAPQYLTATVLKGGSIRLIWQYWTPAGSAAPSEFLVYGGTPTVNYGSPLTTVEYDVDTQYTATITGLTNGDTYQFVVRAANSVAIEQNTNVVTAVAVSIGPSPPQSLSASASN